MVFLPTWVDFWAFHPPEFISAWFYQPELISGHFFPPELISESILPTWVDFWAFFTHLSWFLGVFYPAELIFGSFSPTWVDFWPPDDPGNEALYLGGHPHPHRIHLQPHLDGFTKMADDGRSLQTPQRSHFFLKHARIYLVLSIFVGINSYGFEEKHNSYIWYRFLLSALNGALILSEVSYGLNM